MNSSTNRVSSDRRGSDPYGSRLNSRTPVGKPTWSGPHYGSDRAAATQRPSTYGGLESTGNGFERAPSEVTVNSDSFSPVRSPIPPSRNHHHHQVDMPSATPITTASTRHEPDSAIRESFEDIQKYLHRPYNIPSQPPRQPIAALFQQQPASTSNLGFSTPGASSYPPQQTAPAYAPSATIPNGGQQAPLPLASVIGRYTAPNPSQNGAVAGSSTPAASAPMTNWSQAGIPASASYSQPVVPGNMGYDGYSYNSAGPSMNSFNTAATTVATSQQNPIPSGESSWALLLKGPLSSQQQSLPTSKSVGKDNDDRGGGKDDSKLSKAKKDLASELSSSSAQAIVWYLRRRYGDQEAKAPIPAGSEGKHPSRYELSSLTDEDCADLGFLFVEEVKSLARKQRAKKGIPEPLPEPTAEEKSRRALDKKLKEMTVRDAVAELRLGGNFTKFGRRGTPSIRYIFVSDRRTLHKGEMVAMPHLCWAVDSKAEPSGQLPLFELRELETGPSDTMKKNAEGFVIGVLNETFSDKQCITLVFSSRTIDIACKNLSQLAIWKRALYLIIYKNRELLAAAQRNSNCEELCEFLYESSGTAIFQLPLGFDRVNEEKRSKTANCLPHSRHCFPRQRSEMAQNRTSSDPTLVPSPVKACQRSLADGGDDATSLKNNPNLRLKFFESLSLSLRTQTELVARMGLGASNQAQTRPGIETTTQANEAKGGSELDRAITSRGSFRSPKPWYPVLMIGVFDVWSQVRKQCAKSLSTLLLLEHTTYVQRKSNPEEDEADSEDSDLNSMESGSSPKKENGNGASSSAGSKQLVPMIDFDGVLNTFGELLQQSELLQICDLPPTQWYAQEGALLFLSNFFELLEKEVEGDAIRKQKSKRTQAAPISPTSTKASTASPTSPSNGNNKQNGSANPTRNSSWGLAALHSLFTKVALPLAFTVQVSTRHLAQEIVRRLVMDEKLSFLWGESDAVDSNRTNNKGGSPSSTGVPVCSTRETYRRLALTESTTRLRTYLPPSGTDSPRLSSPSKSAAADSPTKNLRVQSQESIACAAVEGAVVLHRLLKGSLPSALVDRLAEHSAASVRHQTAEALAQGDPSDTHPALGGAASAPSCEPPDRLATLIDLAERTLKVVPLAIQEGGGKWEPAETFLMALHILVMDILHKHTSIVSSPPRALLMDLILAVTNCIHKVTRFDVRRIAGQLLPLLVQLVARSAEAQHAKHLLQLANTLPSETRAIIIDVFLLFSLLHVTAMEQSKVPEDLLRQLRADVTPESPLFRLFNYKPSYVSIPLQRARERKAERLIDILGSISETGLTLKDLPPYSCSLYATYFLAWRGKSIPEDLLATLREHWANAASDAKIRGNLCRTAPDFAARQPRTALLHLTGAWCNIIAQCSAEPHNQCLLTEALHLALKGRRVHRPFYTVTVTDMQSPTFEDDPEGVGSGLHFVREHLQSLPLCEAVAATLDNLESKEPAGSEQGEGDVGAAPAESSNQLRIDFLRQHLKLLLSKVYPNPSTEPSAISRLTQLALTCVNRKVLTKPEVFEICIRQRLTKVVGAGWRTHSPAGKKTDKKASEDDWDDSDDDDAAASSSTAAVIMSPADEVGAVQGISFQGEISASKKLLLALNFDLQNNTGADLVAKADLDDAALIVALNRRALTGA